jgi:hypothetical protein
LPSDLLVINGAMILRNRGARGSHLVLWSLYNLKPQMDAYDMPDRAKKIFVILASNENQHSSSSLSSVIYLFAFYVE